MAHARYIPLTVEQISFACSLWSPAIIKTLIRCQVFLAGQRPTNWDTIFTTLRWTETLHIVSHKHTHIDTHTDIIPEGLRFNVLIREDVKV